MNINILHSHLMEFLETKAIPQKIAECLSLCGPSVDHLEKYGKALPAGRQDFKYDIEIITNRVDSASVIGIAREAQAILPQFGIKANYIPLQLTKLVSPKSSLPLKIQIDKKLNNRVMAVILEVQNKPTPKWMTDRLEASGMRSLNIIIDITNYVMLETGHPTHVFDYDKIKTHTLKFRLSRKGEKITTLDNKTYSLPGGDIVIDNSKGEIVDLPGIMGTKNSVVDQNTKHIIFFLDNNDPVLMRKSSLNLNIRTMAVQLNEKSVDPELAPIALSRGVKLYSELASGKIQSKVFDYYPYPYTPKKISLTLDLINKKIGIEIAPIKIISILKALGFDSKQKGKNLEVWVPSYRAHEVDIPEDIVEEIARIYGYFNLPSEIMTGVIPLEKSEPVFRFEDKLRSCLKGFGALEVYSLALVSKEMVGKDALKLKNPLGEDTAYMRTSLVPSLLLAKSQNAKHDKFHIFEIANVYLPAMLRKAMQAGLPTEELHLAGVFKGFDYAHAKGTLEALFEILHIKAEFKIDANAIAITTNDKFLGFMEIQNNSFTYEVSVAALFDSAKDYQGYIPTPKYPPQVEDITFVVPQGIKVGNVLDLIKQQKQVADAQLKDIYKNAFTFRIYYQDPDKTLTDREVEKIREKIIKKLNQKFAILLQS